MITVLDAFALSFDSIDVDPARTPRALEHAREIAAPPENEPGFYLRDDAGGRFVIDRDTGLVLLADPSLYEREPNAEHRVRVHVIEQSGERYELELNLRITGNVPQMVGADDLALAQPAETIAPVAKPRRRISFAAAPQPQAAPAEPTTPWNVYAVVRHTPGGPTALQSTDAAFGALIAPPQPPALTISGARLDLVDPLPAPSAPDAPWSV